MEKYLIIIVVFIGLYFLYTKCVQGENESFDNESITNESLVNETFENVTLGSADDQNAINKLAQIATKLMEGGLTVPGNMNVSGNVGAREWIAVDNPINEGGRIRIINSSKKAGGLTQDWSIWNMTGQYGNKLAFWRYNTDSNAGPTLELFDNGTVNVVNTLTAANVVANNSLGVAAGGGTVMTVNAGGVNVERSMTVAGNISTGVNVWNTSRDGQNRTYYENNGRTFYGSANGLHTFRTGGNGGGQDLVTIGNNKLQLEGRLFIRRLNMKATDGYDGPGQIGGTSSIDDCAQKCVDRAPQTQVAMRRKTDGYCWCKDANVYMHPANDVDSMITY